MVGQFKEDRLQNHNHSIPNNNLGDGQIGGSNTQGVTNLYNSINTFEISDGGGFNARKGNTTRGKRKGVIYIIKTL